MFTGIVSAIGRVSRRIPAGDGTDTRFEIDTPWYDTRSIPLGSSIACAGCCLTVIETSADSFAVQVSAETLSRTLLHAWDKGTQCNLERALKMGDELGGHLVSGHVDGVAKIVSVAPDGGSIRLELEISSELARFVAEKGSVTLDGVSLTVNSATDTGFGVNIIPHTAAMTTLGVLQSGDAVHIEIDMLARYVARLTKFMEKDS